MTATILEIISSCLKLLYMIASSWMAWKEEERNRFIERMKTISGLLKEAVINKEETLNEDAYLSNLEWEKQERYKVYRDQSLRVILAGDGLSELLKVTISAMNLRVEKNKDLIIQILTKNLDSLEKSKLIAKALVDN